MFDIDQATISALIQAAGLAIIAGIQKQADWRREQARLEKEAARASEAEWRADVDQRMKEFEKVLESMSKKIDATLRGQLTDMRTDLVHKAHRYLDDLRCASTEEKNAFDEQFKTYAKLCKENDIKNDFINTLHDQVMALPGRSID